MKVCLPVLCLLLALYCRKDTKICPIFKRTLFNRFKLPEVSSSRKRMKTCENRLYIVQSKRYLTFNFCMDLMCAWLPFLAENQLYQLISFSVRTNLGLEARSRSTLSVLSRYFNMDLIKPLDDAVDKFIKHLFNNYDFSAVERKLWSLPVRMGGMVKLNIENIFWFWVLPEVIFVAWNGGWGWVFGSFGDDYIFG